jgi:hypothetical protein
MSMLFNGVCSSTIGLIIYACCLTTSSVLLGNICKIGTISALFLGAILIIAGIVESAKLEILEKINEKFLAIKAKENQ